ADDGPVEDVERSKQGRGAMALVVVRHGAEPALLQRQARQGAIESLDLALLVERKHDGVGRRIDIEPDHVAQLVDEVRIVRELELPITVRLKPVRAFQMRRTALALMPLARAIRSAVQWVVSTGGSASVSVTTRAATSGPSGGMREGRVLSCRRPAMPSFMNRSCQRQTQVFDLPVRRMISLVPTPSALERMIAARQACFCEALRSLVIASSRPRTDRVIVMEIPVRMHQTRTATETGESQSGLFCQAKTTRRLAIVIFAVAAFVG